MPVQARAADFPNLPWQSQVHTSHMATASLRLSVFTLPVSKRDQSQLHVKSVLSVGNTKIALELIFTKIVTWLYAPKLCLSPSQRVNETNFRSPLLSLASRIFYLELSETGYQIGLPRTGLMRPIFNTTCKSFQHQLQFEFYNDDSGIWLVRCSVSLGRLSH